MFRRHKKSQGISINTIIIAAIALAVLVVLFVIFTGRFKIFSEGVSKTSSCENACISLNMEKVKSPDGASCATSKEHSYLPGKYGDVPENEICCCRTKQ